jgi:hypothetical protein
VLSVGAGSVAQVGFVPFLFVLGPRLAGFALVLLDQMLPLVHVHFA